MLRTARQIMDGMAGLQEMTGHALPLRIGVNRGNVFAGGFGPDFRRTFSIKGDAVNLAARVMGKAATRRDPRHRGRPGAVADAVRRPSRCRRSSSRASRCRSTPPRSVRCAGCGRDRQTETPFVGRERELAELRARARLGAWSAPAGRSRWSASRASASPAGRAGCWPRTVATDGALAVHFASCGEYESTHGVLPVPPAAPRGARPRVVTPRPRTPADRLAEVVAAAAPKLGVWLPLLGIPLGLDLPDTQRDPRAGRAVPQGSARGRRRRAARRRARRAGGAAHRGHPPHGRRVGRPARPARARHHQPAVGPAGHPARLPGRLRAARRRAPGDRASGAARTRGRAASSSRQRPATAP